MVASSGVEPLDERAAKSSGVAAGSIDPYGRDGGALEGVLASRGFRRTGASVERDGGDAPVASREADARFGAACERLRYHYARDSLGALDRIGSADVRAFARTWYGPNNASLVLAGHFQAGRALDLVQRYFGRIDARPAPPRPALPLLASPGNLWLDVEAIVTHPVAMMMWRGPPSRTPEQRALSVAMRLLAAPQGPLGRRFVDNDGDALRITSREISANAGSVCAVFVEPKEGIALSELLPAVQGAMAAFPDEVTDADVARVEKRLSEDARVSLETSVGRASYLADCQGGASWGIDEYDGVDRVGVMDSLRRYLAPEERVTMVVRPATRALFGESAVLLHRDRMAR